MIDPKVIEKHQEAFKIAKIQHFTPFEFTCRCGNEFCDLLELDMGFIELLDDFRNYVGMPFRITSGYRCAFHTAEQAKIHPGPHRLGMAADIAFVGISTHKFLYELGWYESNRSLRPCPASDRFTGIGMNQKGDHDERFIHLDTCVNQPYRPRPHVWTY